MLQTKRIIYVCKIFDSLLSFRHAVIAGEGLGGGGVELRRATPRNQITHNIEDNLLNNSVDNSFNFILNQFFFK